MNKKYETTTKATSYTDNAVIIPDGYTSLIFVNTGNDIVFIQDNIPVLPGTTLKITNNPDTEIKEDIRIRFEGIGSAKKFAVMRIYYK
jgi:hypothetical protein